MTETHWQPEEDQGVRQGQARARLEHLELLDVMLMRVLNLTPAVMATGLLVIVVVAVAGRLWLMVLAAVAHTLSVVALTVARRRYKWHEDRFVLRWGHRVR